ncbi:hypothetical protein UlMin_022435 [Ulmus minor]
MSTIPTEFENTSTPTNTPQHLEPSNNDSNHASNGTPDHTNEPTSNLNPTPTPIVTSLDGCENKRKHGGGHTLTSTVWAHFKRQKIGDDMKAICNYCSKKLSAGSGNGTSHLRTHVNRCLMKGQKDIKQSLLNLARKGDETIKLETYNFDPTISRNELRDMIILHDDILKFYNAEKDIVLKMLEKNRSRIGITTDMWTSSTQKKQYMVITAHYLDDSWTLKNRIIRFVYVPSPHNAESLTNILLECMMDWNIDRNLSTLTLENATTNDAMVDKVKARLQHPSGSLLLNGDLFHMRCAAHILNLIVKEGFKNIENGIEAIRTSVSFWIVTPKRKEKFEEAARQLNIGSGKSLELDLPTRWNSTYLMLEVALIYKTVFARLKQREPQYKFLPSEHDWVMAKEMCERLSPFYKATLLFSGTNYPTSNLFFPEICEVKLGLRQ